MKACINDRAQSRRNFILAAKHANNAKGLFGFKAKIFLLSKK